MANFSATLGTLLSLGVSLLDAIAICVDATDNVVIARDFSEVRKKIMEGQTLTGPLSKIEYFPEIVTQMVRVSEPSGQIDSMLGRVKAHKLMMANLCAFKRA